MSMAVVDFSSAARGRDALEPQNRRPCHNLPNSLCATAGGRRGPKFARMLLSLSATSAPALESRDGRCGALCGAKIYRWGSGSMNGTRAEPGKFGLDASGASLRTPRCRRNAERRFARPRKTRPSATFTKTRLRRLLPATGHRRTSTHVPRPQRAPRRPPPPAPQQRIAARSRRL